MQESPAVPKEMNGMRSDRITTVVTEVTSRGRARNEVSICMEAAASDGQRVAIQIMSLIVKAIDKLVGDF